MSEVGTSTDRIGPVRTYIMIPEQQQDEEVMVVRHCCLLGSHTCRLCCLYGKSSLYAVDPLEKSGIFLTGQMGQ